MAATKKSGRVFVLLQGLMQQTAEGLMHTGKSFSCVLKAFSGMLHSMHKRSSQCLDLNVTSTATTLGCSLLPRHACLLS